MDGFVERLIEMGMGTVMDRSRDALAASDADIRELEAKEEDAAQRFRSIGLTGTEAETAGELFGCIQASAHRYADIAYMAGIRDAAMLLSALGAIKEPENCGN